MGRFVGTVEYLADVDVRALAEWLTPIPAGKWPSDSSLIIVGWHGFPFRVAQIVDEVLALFPPGSAADGLMVSIVLPGRSIPPRIDDQPPNWLCRVYVPLLTNPESQLIVGEQAYHMEVGKAYRVNTEAIHSLVNGGTSPILHFICDIKI